MSPFELRAGFELAVLAVTWAAITLLALMVAGLWARLRRLESVLPAPERAAAFGHLLGRSLAPAAAGDAVEAGEPGARLVVLLRPDCRSCRRVLSALADPGWSIPTVLVWREPPPEAPVLSPAVRVAADGSRIAATLGVGITPFAAALDGSGRIAAAAPVGDGEALAGLAARAGRPASPLAA